MIRDCIGDRFVAPCNGGTVLDDQTPPRSVPEPDRASPRASQRFPGWIWGVYLLLFGVSVPWYIPANAPLRIWLGLPHWVVISLLATLGVAVFTAFVIGRFWPDEEHPES